MFEWDKSKAKKNQSKHGISFADTFAVFEDPNAVTLEDFRRGLVVVYTWREDNIRIISARKAVRYEVKQYEDEI
jgi:uncharacterized DUF497 family protein